MNQGVGKANRFIRTFRERLIDCRGQEWEDDVQTSDRFSVCGNFNSILHCTKMYITKNVDRHLKCIMTKFRFGIISGLSVHYYWYKCHVEKDLKCPLCGEAKEDEVHFVLCCPMLDDIRKHFIPPSSVNILVFLGLVCCWLQQPGNCQKTYIFLYKAFKIMDPVTT